MLATLIAASVLAPESTTVTTASLFKNGYAVVMREMPVSGEGDVRLTDLPQSALGTLWITASEGVTLSHVIRTSEVVKDQRDADSLDEVLAANVGKAVKLGLDGSDPLLTRVVEGTLLSAGGQIVMIKTEKGVFAFRKGYVSSVTGPDRELSYKVHTTSSRAVLKLHVSSRRSGKIYMVGLESGLTWSPSYAIDISDPKSLSLVAKSTVLDDLADLNNVELKFVTGFPNVPWLTYLDPLLSGNSVDQFVNMLQSVGMGNRDNAMLAQNAAQPMIAGAAGHRFAEAFPENNTPGVQAEDLFFYRQPEVTLKKGDRAYYVMFSTKSDYEHLYTLDLVDSVVNNVEYRPAQESALEVWHSLKFRNTAKQPLTTAPATVFKNGEVLGQDTLKYSSAGSEVLVKMSKALDVHAEHNEEEVTRERANLRLPNGSLFDLVTLKGTVALENFKGEAVKMKIDKDITGEVSSSDGAPQITKVAKGLQEVNPREHLEWNLEVGAGKKRTLNYTYKLYVRSG